MTCPISEIENVNYFFNLTASILSLIGSSLVIFFILSRKLYKAYAYKILFYISMNDILRATSKIIDFFLRSNELACIITLYMSISVFASNLLWSACLTLTIFQIIVLEKTNFEKLHKYWVLSSNIFVFSLNSLPFITSSYTKSEGFCEIKQDTIGNIWRFGIIYVPGCLIFVFITVLFCKIYAKIKLMDSHALKTMVFDRAFIYALIVACFFFPLMIVRIVQFFVESCWVGEILKSLLNVAVLQGFFNSCVFFRSKSIRRCLVSERFEFRSSLGISEEIDSKNSLEISYRTNL